MRQAAQKIPMSLRLFARFLVTLFFNCLCSLQLCNLFNVLLNLQLATLQLATLQLATLQLATLQLATLQPDMKIVAGTTGTPAEP